MLLFLVPFSLGILYALYTNHQWEDWYITYRASKNLAAGNGLTFTAGERVYSYTSIINTLLPALFALLSKTHADAFAIWGYRFINCLVLGICAIFLYKTAVLLKLEKVFSFLLVALFSCSILILDNSINGMEAPYMMLFLILLIYRLYQQENLKVIDLVLPFTGLMYTRPDGFVYAGFLIIGFLLFHFNRKEIRAQFPLIRKIVMAALIAGLLYLPWFLFAWYYYGNPIPNTILAKSVFREYNLWMLVKEFIKFPFSLFNDATDRVLSGLFMPCYAFFGGWYHLEWVGRIIATIAFYAFLFPFLPKPARAFSVSLYLVVFYLAVVSGQGGQPWYLPNAVLLFIFFICITLNALYQRYQKGFLISAGYALLSFNMLILLLGAYHFKTQQEIVEFGNRKKIGEWLRTQAKSSKETVFVECLGYIGYFSNLKMYDFPGMSSPEVVAVLKEAKKGNRVRFSEVIVRLEPDWVVLRPWEVTDVNREVPGVLEEYYEKVKVFSVLDQIPTSWYLMGRPYIENDAEFIVYRKRTRIKRIEGFTGFVLCVSF